MLKDFFTDMPSFSGKGDPLCAQTDPDLFMPIDYVVQDDTRTHRYSYISERSAKAICDECPYKKMCFEYAVTTEGIQGIWGGTNENERKKLRKTLGIRLKSTNNRS